jgi:hypothetical protein
VGEENRGLEYMFIMMNAARLCMRSGALPIAERWAYQKAVIDLPKTACTSPGRIAFQRLPPSFTNLM